MRTRKIVAPALLASAAAAALMVFGGCADKGTHLQPPRSESTAAGRTVERDEARVEEKEAPAPAVLVTAYDANGAETAREWGFFVSPRRLVIHRHMFRGADRLEVQGSDGREFVVTEVLAEEYNLDTILLMTDAPADERQVLRISGQQPQNGDRLTLLWAPAEGEATQPELTISDTPKANWGLDGFFFVDGEVSEEASGCPTANDAGEVAGYGTFIVADGRPIRLIISSKVIEGLMRRADHGEPRKLDEWMSSTGKDVKLSNMGRVGRLASWAERYADSAACYVEATKAEPANAEMWMSLSLAYSGMGLIAESTKAAETSLGLNPRQGELRFNLAWNYEQLGRDEDAVAMYRERIRLGGADAATYDNLGLAYLRMNRNEEALAAFQDAVRLNGGFTGARINLAVAHNRMGQPEAAAAQLETAIANDPASALAHQNLGDTYLELGRCEDAIRECGKAIEIEPGRADSYVDMGAACLRLGRNDEAVAHLLKAIEIKPDFPIAYRNLACAYGELGRFEESAQAANEAVRLDPGHINAYLDLGYAYRSLKQYDKSVAAYGKALEIDPLRSLAHEGLGYTYLRMGSKDLAMEQYEILKELDPGEAASLLKSINKE